MAEEFDLTGGMAGNVTASNDGEGMCFDLTEVEENKKFEVLPKGTYPAVVDELDFGDSSTGNPMVTVKYSITDPAYENRVVWDYWVLRGKGAEFGLAKLKIFLTRICPEIPINSFNPKDFADQGIAVGRQVQITLGIQTQKKGEYKGEKRNQVKEVLAANEGSFLPGIG